MALDPKSLRAGAVVQTVPGQVIDEAMILHFMSSFYDDYPGGELLMFVAIESKLPVSDPWVKNLRPRDHYIFMSNTGQLVQASVGVVSRMKLVLE